MDLHPLLELEPRLYDPRGNKQKAAAYHHTTSKDLRIEVVALLSLNEHTCQLGPSQASDADDREYHSNPNTHLFQVCSQAGECSRKQALNTSGEVAIHNNKAICPLRVFTAAQQ